MPFHLRFIAAAVLASFALSVLPADAADQPKGVRTRSGTFVPTEVSKDAPDPEIERRSFKVAEGFEVNLWAADPVMAKPIQMNWDARGRLWIASSSMYPQIRPGETPTDKVIVLEDADGDGRAEKAGVFADGLLIPTGIEPGDGGAYVANSTELIHLKDTDDDGKADQRRVVLSGFGTEDTHHLLHTFRWGLDGRLWMNQAIYIHSHVETPHGTKRLMGSGIWRFRPETQELEVFARGMVNPWGHAMDRYGQSFSTDGAGGDGIYYTFPGSAFQSAKSWDGLQDMKRLMKGMNPGSPKYCGLEIVSGRHLPDDWQGNAITNDFRANRVVRYQLLDENGTYVSKQMPDVITSTDVAFRPIDVKMGPDGAIYIADWYNPIIQHGEVDFRDPRRDKTHGRIWRITAKNRALVKRPTLVGAPVRAVLDELKSPEGWTRHQAKLVLRTLGAKDVVPALAEWVKQLDAKNANHEHARLEALWAYQTLDTPEPALLNALLTSKVPQVRAAATRVVPDWATRLPNTIELLKARVADEHARVRLEAVRALARLGTPDAFALALTVLDRPADTNVEYALWTTANEMRPVWMPAFQAGTLRMGDPKHLAYALQAVGARESIPALLAQLRDGKLPNTAHGPLFELVATIGGPKDTAALYDAVTGANADAAVVAPAFAAIDRAIRVRGEKPEGADPSKLVRFVNDKDDAVRAAAIRLAGAWRAPAAREEIAKVAAAAETPPDVRRAAIGSLADFGPESADVLRKLDAADRTFDVRAMAIVGLAALDVKDAATRAAELLAAAPADADPAPVMAAFLQREGGGEALGAAVASSKKIGADVAKLCLRYVNGTGRDNPALTQPLREAAGLGATAKALTPEQMAETVKEVVAKGDAARGEQVFRRSDMSCFQCHGIGGAGGQLAPDLRSIGATSPVDYLVDSILEPNKAIKDGFQSVVIATKSGEMFSGIKLSQDDREIVLRDAQRDAFAVPVASIRRERAGGSLMPGSLADTLTRQEFLDLIKFMSELGKPGTYQPDTALLVRRWRVLDPKAAGRVTGDRLPVEEPALPWTPAYSLVSGVLPVDAMASTKGQTTAVVRGEIEVTAPGKIGLHLGNAKGLTLWLDGGITEAKPDVEVEMTRGVHALTLQVDLAARGDEGLRVEIRDVPGSAGHAQPVGGR